MPFDGSNIVLLVNAKAARKAATAEREARRGRLGKQRADALVNELVAVIKLAFEAGATGSLFGLEGPLRHAIRGDLCLQGWRWKDANIMAEDVLAEAFRRARAVRPTWAEGQPEWVISAGDLIERTRCVRCHKPLPEGHHKFCSQPCAKSHSAKLALRREATDDRAVTLAIRST